MGDEYRFGHPLQVQLQQWIDRVRDNNQSVVRATSWLVTSADGTMLGRFGHFDGQDPAGFPGCCNPTNLVVDTQGRVIVSEKAGPRVKVYDREGGLLAVVADDVFDPGAKNMDLAVDSAGRIYVADTATLEICIFEPTTGEAT